MSTCPHRMDFANGLIAGLVMGAAWAHLWTAYFMGANR